MSRGKRGGEERAEVRTEGVGKSGSHWTALLFLVLSLFCTRHGHLFFFFDHLVFFIDFFYSLVLYANVAACFTLHLS